MTGRREDRCTRCGMLRRWRLDGREWVQVYIRDGRPLAWCGRWRPDPVPPCAPLLELAGNG